MIAAQRRLMDLLAGWMQYVDKCAECGRATNDEPTTETYKSEAEAIHALYQKVGCIPNFHDGDVENFIGEIAELVRRTTQALPEEKEK